MNKFLEEFFSIEGILNRKARDFLLTVQQEGSVGRYMKSRRWL